MSGTQTSSLRPQRKSFWRSYVFTSDHKAVGKLFLFTSLLMMLLGGLLALAMRWQLAWPWSQVPILGETLFADNGGQMSPAFYTALFTMHGTIMIFLVIIPLLTGAFGSFCIPLLIGARQLAFPKLSVVSYWLMWPAGIFLLGSFAVQGGAANAGWTSYAPLSAVVQAAPGSGAGQTLWLLGIVCVAIAAVLGAINFITTIVTMRTKGMYFSRLPLTVWALLITAILQILATPVLGAALLMQLGDRAGLASFFVPADLLINNAATFGGGGQPLLWQHLFWFYSHPAVYIMILPVMGIVSDVIATFARKPLLGYRAMIYALAAIALLGFMVWGHHMFVSGMNPALGTSFALSTMLIALPSGVKVFNWLGTLWRSNIQFTTPMLFALGFLSVFIVGGFSGIFMAALPVDMHVHDTYFVVAHIHYVLMGGSFFGIMAAIYYWFPKLFGRMMNEALGKLHFALTLISFNLTFFAMHFLGLQGMPRRIADASQYASFQHLQPLQEWITYAALALAASQLFFVLNFFWSLFWGERSERNPWRSNTMEWTTPSPAGVGNWNGPVPEVYRGPYEYAFPEVSEDYLPQSKRISMR